MNLRPEKASSREIAAAVRNGSTTARSVTEAQLAHIEATRETLNAFTRVTADRALAESDRVDALIARGEDPGSLAGVPYAVKNLLDLEGEVTLAGSKINCDNPPASKDATAVARLGRSGAICLGALNMGEYAYDFITNNPHYGATRNPHDPSRSAGGSSGGSGAAIAAGLVSLSLGSDTNGSIRVPSSFCGIWGLRPTYGALSRGGTFAFVDSLDTIGPFARCATDLALAFDAIAGPDPRDAACAPNVSEKLTQSIDETIDGIRIARLGGYFSQGGDPFVHEAVDTVLGALDATKQVSLPEPERARTAAYLITASESANRHRDRLKERGGDFDPVIRDRLLSGLLIPSTWTIQAQRFRAWWRQQIAAVFREVDVLIAPATPIRAPLLGEESFEFNGKQVPLRPNIGLFTQPISLVGLPTIAAPVHPQDGSLPCAVQLIGAPNSEATLLRVARELERSGTCQAPTIDPKPVSLATVS